jgi:hypothetical protein
MTTIDKLEIEISTDTSKLTAGMNQANQTVSSFTDRIARSANTLQGFGQIGMHAMGIMDRYEISTMNVQNALMSVQDAQMRYNSALQEFGAGSEQAVLAQNSLERATNQYEAAQMRANLSLATMGLTMFGMIPQILKFGSTAITTLKGVEIAALMTSVRIKAMVPELLILSAIAGGTYYLWTQRTQETQSATEKLTTSVDYSKASLIQLRAEIEKLNMEIGELSKPKRQPQSLMDQFLEYQATGIMPGKITPEQTAIQKKTAEKEKLVDQLIETGPSWGIQKTSTASPKSVYGLTSGGYNPPPGFKEVDVNSEATKENTDMIRALTAAISELSSNSLMKLIGEINAFDLNQNNIRPGSTD